MWKLIDVGKSHRDHKKWVAYFEDAESGKHKTVHFGDDRYEDYTQHHNKERRNAYVSRHDKDLRTGDPKTPGFLSYYVLWGDSTSFEKNLRAYKNMFDL